MKRKLSAIMASVFLAIIISLPVHATSYNTNAPTYHNSVTEYGTLYYEEGPLKIYVGNLEESKESNESRVSYYTRKFELPFTVVYGGTEIATLTAHLTTVGLSRDWCFQDSGTYTYETHVGMDNVLFWEPNTVTSTFIQAAFKIKYINNIIGGEQAIRFYCNPDNGAVTW